MIAGVDLVLRSLHRALTATVLPGVANAAAREEAWLGAVFAGWLRDVVDHAADVERISHRECQEALAEIAEMLGSGACGARVTEVGQMAGIYLIPTPSPTLEEIRAERTKMKKILGAALRACREDGDEETALVVRERLARLAVREIERELAFARATGIDPDAATVPTLGELVAREGAK